KALVEAYEYDKINLDTYEDVVTLKRHHDNDVDKDEEPFAGSDRGSKRRRERKEPELTRAPKEKTTYDLEEPSHQEFETGVADDQPIAKASQHPEWFQQQKKPPTLDRDWNKTLLATHGSIQPLISELAKQADSRFSFNDRKYTTSVTKTKAADYEHIKWIEDLVPRIMWSQEPVSYDKRALWRISHWGRKHQQFYRFAVNMESDRDVYSKRRIIAITELQIVEWHNYKHLISKESLR
nr:hypothetical protein [Tanacetum cinerariifolium]